MKLLDVKYSQLCTLWVVLFFVSDNTDPGHTNFCYSHKYHVSVSNIKQTFKERNLHLRNMPYKQYSF